MLPLAYLSGSAWDGVVGDVVEFESFFLLQWGWRGLVGGDLAQGDRGYEGAAVLVDLSRAT